MRHKPHDTVYTTPSLTMSSLASDMVSHAAVASAVPKSASVERPWLIISTSVVKYTWSSPWSVVAIRCARRSRQTLSLCRTQDCQRVYKDH